MRALFDKTRERFGRRRRPQGENRPEPIRVNPSLSAKMRKAPFGAFCILPREMRMRALFDKTRERFGRRRRPQGVIQTTQ